MQRQRRETTLPRALEVELRRSAKRNAVDHAIKWMEQYVRARDTGKTGVARRAASKAKEAAPRAPSVREALGLAAFAAGDLHEATQELLAFRRLAGARTHDPVIAECYRRQGRPERALELLEGLDRAGVPERVWIEGVIVRARALTDSGRADAARAILESALRAIGPAGRARLRVALTDAKRTTPADAKRTTPADGKRTGGPEASRRSQRDD